MNFTLDTEEFNKAQSKNNVINKLAFAVMLKFFQIENRYPTTKKDKKLPYVPTRRRDKKIL